MDKLPPIPPAQLAILAKENQGPKVVGIVIAFTVLASICVLLRFFARVRFTKQVGWEDWFIAISMTFSILTAACQIKQVEWGSGKHQMFVDLPSTINSLRYLYFSILAYCIGFTFIKISILTQYRRIFSVREMRLPIYIVMGLCVATGVEAFFTFAISCLPVDAIWNVLKRPTAKCLDEITLRYVNGSLNIITDLMVAALPVRSIWQLQLVRKQKIALIVILTLGWFVCIVSILRLNSIVVLARHPEDQMWYGAPPTYWAAIEMNLAIVCACVPALKPLVVKVIPAFSTRLSKNNSNQRSGNSKPSKSSSHSFQRLGGLSSSKSHDLEHGSVGTELSPVTALPAVYSKSGDYGQNHLTRAVDQHPNRRPSNSSSQRLVSQAQHVKR